MPKKVMLFVLGVLLVCFAVFLREALSEDSTTITTYYPSPYGSYNQMEVYRSVTYNPVDKDSLESPREGELVYNASDDSLYLHNSSTWVRQGGNVAMYTPKCSWSCESSTYALYTGPYPYSCTSSCVPSSCAEGYRSLGVGCVAMGGGVSTSTDCDGRQKGIYGNGYGYCERYCVEE